jgi:UDP-N-acetylmuramate--alanine ligase
MAVVTNIDADHLSTYQGDFSILKNTFVEFLKRLPFYGLAVVCLDDPTIREMLVEIASPVLTYGLDSDADLRATDIHQQGRTTHFTLVERGGRSCPVTVNMPGIHNVLNALATIAIAREVGVEDESIFKGLASFSGVGRRFECYENVKLGATSVTWVDDYGHHPREIEATLQAAKASWPDRRIILVFQPHRYSRTRDLLDDFAMILSRADKLVLTEVYAAGEDPIAGADGRALARAVRGHGAVEPVFVPEITRVLNTLENIVNEGDIVLAMGAGSIGSLSKGWQPEPRGAE